MSRQGFDTGAIRYDGSPTNQGSFHRAIACCQHLVERGRWDGQTRIVIHDPYTAHKKVSFYKKDLVEGVDWELIPETPDRWTFVDAKGQAFDYGVGDTVVIRLFADGQFRRLGIRITYMMRDVNAFIAESDHASDGIAVHEDARGFIGEALRRDGDEGPITFGFHDQVVAKEVNRG